MSDDPKNDNAETPMARALRLKKAAQAAKAQPPRGGAFHHKDVSGMAAGASKPAMRK